MEKKSNGKKRRLVLTKKISIKKKRIDLLDVISKLAKENVIRRCEENE